MFSEIHEKDLDELNQRLHDRTQAFLANEVKLLNEIRKLKEENSRLRNAADSIEKSSILVLQKRIYDTYFHEYTDWFSVPPVTVALNFGNDPEKWPEICAEKKKSAQNEEYRVVEKIENIIWKL